MRQMVFHRELLAARSWRWQEVLDKCRLSLTLHWDLQGQVRVKLRYFPFLTPSSHPLLWCTPSWAEQKERRAGRRCHLP